MYNRQPVVRTFVLVDTCHESYIIAIIARARRLIAVPGELPRDIDYTVMGSGFLALEHYRVY